MAAKILRQGISPNRLDRPGRFVGLILLPPTRGLADMNPVGRPVTGARKKLRIDEGLQIMQGMIVDPLPVLRKNPRHGPQDMRGQTVNPNPGQEKKPGIAGDKGKVLLAHLFRPADKPVATTDMPGG